jgi:endo-1,4-beta-D-glucanase Y
MRVRSPDGAATSAARSFLRTYMVDGGRIQRTDQGGDTVGEGQAYGMLLAAGIGDERRFDEIWSWTRAHMEQPDGLLAFHWVGGRVVDPSPASDADLDATRALLVASCTFHRPDLRRSAIRIGNAILARETGRAGPLDILDAGPWADKDGQLAFNPSYVDPLSLRALAAASGNRRFVQIATDSTSVVNQLARPLPPDWASVNTQSGQAIPVSAAGATGGTGLFSYDAPRTLVRMAVDPSPAGRAIAARAWSVFSATQPQDIVTEHSLSGAAIGSTHSPVTLVAVAGAARAAGDNAAVTELLAQAQTFNAQHPTYYGSAWVALGRMLLTTDRLTPACLPGV